MFQSSYGQSIHLARQALPNDLPQGGSLPRQASCTNLSEYQPSVRGNIWKHDLFEILLYAIFCSYRWSDSNLSAVLASLAKMRSAYSLCICSPRKLHAYASVKTQWKHLTLERRVYEQDPLVFPVISIYMISHFCLIRKSCLSLWSGRLCDTWGLPFAGDSLGFIQSSLQNRETLTIIV